MTTRFERLASRSRRLEVVAVVAAAVFTVVLCRLTPDRTADAAAQAADFRHAAESRPDAVRAEWPVPLPRSAPVRVTITGTGVDADVVTSRRAGGALPAAVPGRPMQVAWDGAGPAPGEDGAAVLVGHLDSAAGPAAFAGLGGLRAGTRVAAERADGRTARFQVYAVERYGPDGPPDDFLLAAVSADAGPQLRLVAHGGGWTEQTADDATVVVFAHAVRV